MRSIEKRFMRYAKKNPSLGLYFCLKEAVTGRKFSSVSLSRAFNRLVPKEDYDPKCKKELIAELICSTNTQK